MSYRILAIIYSRFGGKVLVVRCWCSGLLGLATLQRKVKDIAKYQYLLSVTISVILSKKKSKKVVDFIFIQEYHFSH
jgi:hypothetical protein